MSSYYKPWIFGDKRIRIGDHYHWQEAPTLEEIQRDVGEDTATLVALDNAKKADPEHFDKSTKQIVDLTKRWLDYLSYSKQGRYKYKRSEGDARERMREMVDGFQEMRIDLVCQLHDAFSSLGVHLDFNPTPKFWEEGNPEEYVKKVIVQ